ncbi:unnamed protein product [Gadus morhua 'NCC']
MWADMCMDRARSEKQTTKTTAVLQSCEREETDEKADGEKDVFITPEQGSSKSTGRNAEARRPGLRQMSEEANGFSSPAALHHQTHAYRNTVPSSVSTPGSSYIQTVCPGHRPPLRLSTSFTASTNPTTCTASTNSTPPPPPSPHIQHFQPSTTSGSSASTPPPAPPSQPLQHSIYLNHLQPSTTSITPLPPPLH